MESLETIYTVQHKRYVEVDVAMIENYLKPVLTKVGVVPNRQRVCSSWELLVQQTNCVAAVPLVMQYPKPVE